VLDEGDVPAWQRLASLLLAAPLGGLSVPATALAGAMGSGATMALYARKER
jgi:hypothetical protein